MKSQTWRARLRSPVLRLPIEGSAAAGIRHQFEDPPGDHEFQRRAVRSAAKWLSRFAPIACLALLACSAVARAETRCVWVGPEWVGWNPKAAVSFTFSSDHWFPGPLDLSEQPLPSRGGCNPGTAKDSYLAGPFRVVRGDLGEFDVTYYQTVLRTLHRVNGQCEVEEEVWGFPGLNANGETDLVVSGTSCVTRLETTGTFAPPAPQSCPRDGEAAGNPILPATAEKFRAEIDYEDFGPAALNFGRTYRSTWGADTSRAAGPMGKAWAHNHGATLRSTGTSVTLTSAEGYVRSFARSSISAPWTAIDSADTLSQAGTTWVYGRTEDDSTLRFDAAGKLLSITARNGWTTSYVYEGSRLARISNPFNRQFYLHHDVAGRLTVVNTPGGGSIGYEYDGLGRLSLVKYPDGNRRSFLYENVAFPQALTGILDEAGARFATFAYDAQGRAISAELAGNADRYQVSYPATGTASVVDPLGTSRTYFYGTTQGKLAVTGASLPSGKSAADAASRVQDANGLVTSETDFKGVTTRYTWDAARRLPLSVTTAAGTPEARTVTTQWHATFSLPVLITEAGRTTAYTYDAQGNRLSQTLADTATSKAQLWQWTYNPQGLAATQTAPNGAVTTYTYAYGALTSAVNALGQETLYAYDGANRVARVTAPNGLTTVYSYDARDRLLTQTVGGHQTTALTYNPTGTLATLTLPTGLVLNYTYDAAHRLTGWSNNRGEQGSFTLDAMGNRVGEQIKNSSGAIAWNAARSINSLNRVSARTEGFVQTSSFGYDANGELVAETDGLNQSTRYGLDPLRRVAAITDAANATAALSYNALDAVIQARDFKGVATTYARDAQGSATHESSADIGNKSTRHDALGLPSTITDALGQATQIQRDALGRPTILIFADGKSTSLRYDLTPASRGYLSEIVDRSGTTEYSHDSFGRVTAKRQTLVSGLVHKVGYAYGPNGQLASISYPDGSVLAYQHDGTGRLVQINRNGSPLVTGIAWNPMGQPTAWTWAFAGSLNANRGYDAAGRLTWTEFASYVYDAAGRITSLTQKLFLPASSNPTHTSIVGLNLTSFVGYDTLGRIVSFNGPGNQASFGYDANGNRTSSTLTRSGQSSSRSYGVAAGSNRLQGFSQTAGGATTSIAYGYNANGDLTHDGLRTYSYDVEGRLSAVTTGATDASPTTRYAHNALGQRVFKTEPLYPPNEGDETDPGFFQGLVAFFTKLWGPAMSDAEKLGFAYVYDEEGSLLAETGTGGANSSGSTQYIYLPTANGPMPIAVVINGSIYAVHSDHLNTPRRLTNSQGQVVWQWAYSAFGEEKPTIAKYRFANLDITPNPGTTNVSEVTLNKRFAGQYVDVESGLHYNYFRTYDPRTGRYIQGDPIGLGGGWNRFGYVGGNPLGYSDSLGLDQWSADPLNNHNVDFPTQYKPGDTTIAPVPSLAGNISCLQRCVGRSLIVSGGSEGKPYHQGDGHPQGRACDFGCNSNPGLCNMPKEKFSD